MRLRLLFLCAGLIYLTAGFAATDKPGQNHPETGEVSYSGYVDVSYNYLLRSNQFVSGEFNRVNDLATNGFTLQQAALTLSKRPTQGLGGLINFILGRDANGIAPAGMNPDVFGARDIGFAVPQAYLQYRYSTFVIKAGEMLSLAGLEQFDYTQDSNFSRSILDGYAQAGTHMGIRVMDEVTDQLRLIVGVNNGWDTVRRAADLDTVEMAVGYAVHPQFSVMVDGYAGEQHLTDNAESGPTGKRYLLDWYGTWYITERMSLAANYDYGIQTRAALPNGSVARADWKGIAVYLNYLWNDKWRTSLRGEVFADSDGYRTGVRQNWREMTLTLAYVPLKNWLLRAETRHDFSNVSAFKDKSDNGARNNQQSYAIEALFQF